MQNTPAKGLPMVKNCSHGKMNARISLISHLALISGSHQLQPSDSGCDISLVLDTPSQTDRRHNGREYLSVSNLTWVSFAADFLAHPLTIPNYEEIPRKAGGKPAAMLGPAHHC
jgi:hypothetical protein